MRFILSSLFLISAFLAKGQEAEVWSLSDCLSYARENSITVKQAMLGQNSAAVGLEQAEYQRYPNLTGAASYSFTNGQSIDPITSDYVNQQVNAANFSLNSQVTLYSGGQLKNQVAQNELLVAQNKLYVAEAQNDISLSIIEAYLQALYVKENIDVAEINIATSTRQLEQAKTRHRFGELTAQGVAEVESQLATNQYQLVTATNAFNQQVLSLKQLLELTPETIFNIDTTTNLLTNQLQIPELVRVYQTARQTMPQVEASELDMQISQLDLEIARGGYKPSLSANARLLTGQTSTRDIDFFDQLNGNFNQQVGLSLSIPIFDRKQTSSEVQRALIGIEQARLQQQAVDKELYRNIETTWQNATAALSEANAAESVRNASQTAFLMTQQQYDLGEANATDLLVSQNNYITAERQYLQAKYAGILYYALLQFYLGAEINI